MTHTARLNPLAAAPDAYKAVIGLDKYVRGSVDKMLLHLLKVRASQINGCVFCVDMHTKEALDDGEDPQRLYLLVAWRESSLYTDKERAVLTWTESLTNLAQTGAPDADYDVLRPHFSEAEIVHLTIAIATINVWNRLAVGFRTQHPVGMDKRFG